jgi:hypothetical protein
VANGSVAERCGANLSSLSFSQRALRGPRDKKKPAVIGWLVVLTKVARKRGCFASVSYTSTYNLCMYKFLYKHTVQRPNPKCLTGR